ncbi:phosphatidylglycerophosphatase A [Granulicella cerasi]|uniref:Phosphatidylglycerophosphatase A n=1 Tax=Granulicella cerasi TaxID=741063 RepID=A0ABW1ZC34_9BACT|nr:phosphatidylglycerophosphatase A [Granulicella cerasi]
MASIEKRTPWAWTVATFVGVGNLKPGPGTYGSAAAMLLWMLAAHLWHPSFLLFTLATFAAMTTATLIGIPASTITAREAGREDPGFVVIDEVAGQLFALVALTPTWPHALLALALFRLFDIWKPWPIRRFEDLPEGTGIMLDDVVAGAFAFIAAQLLTHFVPALR